MLHLIRLYYSKLFTLGLLFLNTVLFRVCYEHNPQIVTLLVMLLCLYFKFVNSFKKNTTNARILNVSFHISHNTHYSISSYLSSRLTIYHNRYLVKVEISKKGALRYVMLDYWVWTLHFSCSKKNLSWILLYVTSRLVTYCDISNRITHFKCNVI